MTTPEASDPRSELADPRVRANILRELGADALRPVPARALLVVPLVLAIGVTSWLAVCAANPVVAVLGSVIAGVAYGSLFFLGHEISHGGTVRPGFLRSALAWICFEIFLLSPHFWTVWHQRAHHPHTNELSRDPDIYGTVEEVAALPARRFVMAIAPGSGRWLSALYPFLWFFGQGQAVLWSTSHRRTGFESLDRTRAVVEMFAMALPWVLLTATCGARGLFLGFLLPFFIANAVVMSFVMTNHMVAPLGPSPTATLDTTWSVLSPRWIDLLFLNFSHHVEHHLFPTAPSSALPAVRAVLERRYGAEYQRAPHLTALRAVYGTPRPHAEDGQALVDPATGRTVSLPLQTSGADVALPQQG